MSSYRVISPGHKYELLNLDDPHTTEPQKILFVKKQKIRNDEILKTTQNGTTNEAVIGVVLHRLEIQYEKLPSKEQKSAIAHLKSAIKDLKKRTLTRQKAGVEGTLLDLDAKKPGASKKKQALPDDVPHGTYLEKNGITTVASLLAIPQLEDLKGISEERAIEIQGWIEDNS